MNDGFSGDGNAIFSYAEMENTANVKQWISDNLREKLKMVAGEITYDAFLNKFKQMKGIVEALLTVK